MPAWRALRVVAERGGRGRTDTLEAPFVGRDDELRLVKDLFHATAREGRARLVSITGVGGIGKSRLAWEFEKYLDGILEPVWWHRGRSPAYGEGVTFWALSEMVRGRAGLAETDDEATTRAKVVELLDGLDLDEPDRRWIESSLLALLGVEAGIGAEQLFGAWRTFFERLAATGPVVLVFEDLHWADSGTLDFVDHLLDWSRAMPIYVVTLARPELMDHRPNWGSGRRNFTSIHVEPLADAAMASLLHGLVPGLPESATRQVVARADGIPLYAVETVRMLLTDGRLAVADDGTYVLTTAVFSSPGAPFTRTRPALIRSSARRREATPARARYAFSLMPSLFGCAALHLLDALDLAGRGRAPRLARARRGGGADHRGGRRRAHRRLRDAGALRRGRRRTRRTTTSRSRSCSSSSATVRSTRRRLRVHARRSRSDHPQALALTAEGQQPLAVLVRPAHHHPARERLVGGEPDDQAGDLLDWDEALDLCVLLGVIRATVRSTASVTTQSGQMQLTEIRSLTHSEPSAVVTAFTPAFAAYSTGLYGSRFSAATDETFTIDPPPRRAWARGRPGSRA